MIIVFLGPPGAGKGTQAEKIAQTFHFKKLSTGDLLREQVTLGTELGLRAAAIINRGELVDDATIVEMVQVALKLTPPDVHVILDGFPRTLDQCVMLEPIAGDRITAAFHFDVEASDVLRRLSGRLTCSVCARVYHREFQPSARGETCETCSSILVQRVDDEAQRVLRRLDVYNEQTRPVIDFYKKQRKYCRVDASGQPEVVMESLMVEIKRHLHCGK